MGNHRVCIVTDASIDLNTAFIERYGVLVIPRRIQIGGKKLEVDRHKPLSLIGRNSRKPFRLVPSQLSDFLRVYRTGMGKDLSFLSIHGPRFLDDACDQANVARHMLLPDIEVRVFEAMTLGAGVRFLVESVAVFAQERDSSLEKTWAFLQRLQHEITTLLVAGHPGQLPCDPRPSLWQRIKGALLGVKTWWWLDKGHRLFRPYGGKSSAAWRSGEGPWKTVFVSYRPKRQMENFLRREGRQFRGQDPRFVQERVQRPALPKDFIAVLLLPAPSRVQAIARWVQRWG